MSSRRIVLEPLGDRAFLVRGLPYPGFRLADCVSGLGLPGLVEVVPCYDSVGFYVEQGFELELLDSALARAPTEWPARQGRTHTIPVDYGQGENLSEVCESLGLTPDELIQAHTAQEYTCYAIGFCPGFAYLGYLPPVLEGIPRLPSPRTKTPVGSVALTGRQTAVYPLERPGGWPLIGKTPLVLVDDADGYFPIEPGDSVRFESVDIYIFEELRGQRL